MDTLKMQVVKTTDWVLNLSNFGISKSDKSFCVTSDAESVVAAYLKDKQVNFVLNNHLFVIMSSDVIVNNNMIYSVNYRTEYYIEED